jgi:hypothetical protein
MKTKLAAVVLLLAPAPALTHRLDEYLQGTILSIGKNRLEAQITLTPGVAVFPMLATNIDTDADGVVSETEQRAYAGRVLRDLSLSIDGRPLMPQLLSMQFPSIDEMKEGRGGIRIDFKADLPRGGPSRRLVFENRHQSRVGAYLVNCLVPRDPDIRIVAQNRNYSQSLYQLDYVQTGVRSGALSWAWWSGDPAWLGTVALLLFARLAFLWRQRSRAANARAGLEARPATGKVPAFN